MGVFSYDGVIGRAINRIFDCVCLSFLWIVFSIPVITMGAASTALYYTVNKVFREEEGGLLKSFWRSFKSNFLQTFPVWLVFLVVYIVFLMNGYYGYAFFANDVMPGGILIVLIVVAAILLTWSGYIFPYIARFENTTRETLKNCAYLMVRHLPWSLALLAILLGSMVLFFLVPFGLAFAPAVWGWTSNLVLERIFAKYIPSNEPEEA